MTQSREVAAPARGQNDFSRELDAYTPALQAALPSHVSVERFKRVVITAVSTNPDLLYANRRTLYTAAVRAASDGLLPDGREAALVVYNTEVRQRNPDTGLDQRTRQDVVQYLPMVAGIRKRMRNTGDVESAIAEVVCRADTFSYRLGDDPYIRHEPPPLGQDRGEIIGAYAIIRLKNGEVIRDVMSRADIERHRGQSRAANSMMWSKFYEEGCKKTVLRRASKAAPQAAEFEAMMARDEEPAMIPVGEMEALPHAEPEPEPAPPHIEHEEAAEPEPEFVVTDLEGECFGYHTPVEAGRALVAILRAAAKQDLPRLEGAWESNQALVDEIGKLDGKVCARLYAERDALRPKLQPPEPEAEPPATASEPEPTGQGEHFIEAPLRNGKPDWRTWAVALFLPRLRQQTDSATLAFFMGDNESNLAQARNTLRGSDLGDLEAAIKEQWKVAG